MKCGACGIQLDFRADCWLIPHEKTDKNLWPSEQMEFEHWVCPICGWETA